MLRCPIVGAAGGSAHDGGVMRHLILSLSILFSASFTAANELPPLGTFSQTEFELATPPLDPLTVRMASEETDRNAASLRWPGGPNSTYVQFVSRTRRPGDPARDIVTNSWPGRVGAMWHVDESGRERNQMLIAGDIATAWDDTNAAIAQMNRRRTAIASAEYIFFRMGAKTMIAPAVYGQVGQLPPFEAGRSLQNPWLNTILFPSDSRGDDCVSLNRVRSHVSGCGDVWQDGIDPENELACFEGKTYLRCHLWCLQQVREPALSYSNGPCRQAQ